MDANDAVKTVNVIKRAIGDLKFIAKRSAEGQDMPETFKTMIRDLREFGDTVEQRFPEAFP